MVSWTLFAFECEDESARRALMEWFESNHPVEFPDDRYSTFAEITTADGTTTGADYAWLDRYLYVTVMSDVEQIAWDTMDRWERAAIAKFDGRTETVSDGVLVLDTEAGAEDEVEAHPLEGPPELAGNGLMYALAMRRQFRFRAYSAASPTTQVTPHPDAFTVPTEFADDFETFLEDMEAATGVEPTADGIAFLRNDPADDERYVYGETYGPADEDESSGGLGRATVQDLATGAVETYEDPEEVDAALDDPGNTVTNTSLLKRLKSLLR